MSDHGPYSDLGQHFIQCGPVLKTVQLQADFKSSVIFVTGNRAASSRAKTSVEDLTGDITSLRLSLCRRTPAIKHRRGRFQRECSRMLPWLSCTFLKWHAKLDFGRLQFAITNRLGSSPPRNAWVSRDATTRQHSIDLQSSSGRDNSVLR
jgi:hypothetical protein